MYIVVYVFIKIWQQQCELEVCTSIIFECNVLFSLFLIFFSLDEIMYFPVCLRKPKY